MSFALQEDGKRMKQESLTLQTSAAAAAEIGRRQFVTTPGKTGRRAISLFIW